MSKKPKADEPHFDRGQPEGIYQSDAFFPQFTPDIPLHKLSDEDRRPYFELFRYDVDRAVRVARIRAQYENEIESTRRQALYLQEILGVMRPELKRIADLGDSVDFVARVSMVFQPRAEETPAADIKVILTQLLDVLQGPRSSRRRRANHPRVTVAARPQSYLLKWLRKFDRYEIVSRLPPRRKPLARHLTEQAIKLYERRLAEPVPASRQHWLGQFLAALWRDIRQTVPAGDMDALADHFGRRVEDAVKHPEKIPQLKILHRKKSRS